MDQNRRQLLIALGLGGAAFLVSGAARAEKKYDVGASDTEIKIGNTDPYSGPASSYGTIPKAMAAYYRMMRAMAAIRPADHRQSRRLTLAGIARLRQRA